MATTAQLLVVSGLWAWQTAINGTSVGASDFAFAITVDAGLSVVAAGTTHNDGSGLDFTVVKLDAATGVELWRQELSGTAPTGSDQAQAVSVDAAGDVVAAGQIRNTDTGSDFFVIKLDGVSGAERWRREIAGTAPSGSDVAVTMKVDAAGDVVAAGRIANTGSGNDFFVVKLDGVSGAERWRREIAGTLPGGFDQAQAVIDDGAGDVVAAGLIQNTGSGNDFFVVKLDGVSGAERWRREIAGTATGGFDHARAMSVDAAGDVVATGLIQNTGSGNDFFVVKLDGVSGAERWRREIAGTAPSGSDLAQAVSVDAAGDVVVAGRIENDGSGVDLFVVKLDGASGAERWRREIAGTTPRGSDLAEAVSLDAVGDVVAAGRIENTGSGVDFFVIKLDGADGAERWRRAIAGTAPGGFDLAQAVSVDAAGNVVAAGGIESTDNGQEFFVVKLVGADGTDF